MSVLLRLIFGFLATGTLLVAGATSFAVAPVGPSIAQADSFVYDAHVHDYDPANESRASLEQSASGVIHSYDHVRYPTLGQRALEPSLLAAKAGRGGAGPVRVGQAGENAVRAAYDIGPKIKVDVAGRKRIPDGLTPTTLSEVKNVGSLSYTRQIRDFEAYAQQSGRTFDLFVRRGARLSGPLREADAAGRINIRDIP